MIADTLATQLSRWPKLLKLLCARPTTAEGREELWRTLTHYFEENNRLFRTMTDAFKAMIYVCSRDFRLEYINERMIDHLGRDATGELCHQAFGRKSVCPWCVNQRIFKGETIRWQTINPLDGRWYEVINTPVRHPDGGISKFVVMVDIDERKQIENELKRHHGHLGEQVRERTRALTSTNDQLRQEIEDRKQVEEALRLSETNYRDLIQNANSLIIRFDSQGRLTFFNDYAQHVLGYRQEEIVGRQVQEILFPLMDTLGRNREAQFADFLKEPGKYNVREFENVCGDGELAWIAWNNRPILDAGGRTVEFLGVGMDITERVRNREQVRTLTHELIKTQENERARIARDLHDHIAQDLSSLKIRLQTLFDHEAATQEPFRQQMNDMIAILQRSISEVRNLAYDLRPPELDQLGLVRTLFVYCEDFARQNGLKIDYVAAGLDGLDLDDDIQINIYRLIQEALHNVKKHAQAEGVTIRLVASSPNLMLRIIDDGRGFDVQRHLARGFKKKRMGLQSMVERVKLLDGTFNMRSQFGKGTGIFITIPIKEKQRGCQNPNRHRR